MPTIQALLVPSDEEIPVKLVEFEQGDINAIQKFVGGYFDVADSASPAVSLFLNDEGKLQGLPMNRRATMFLWAGDSRWRHQDVLMGDVVITGQPDESGDTTSIPDGLVQLITAVKEYRYEVQTIGSEAWSGNGRRFTSYWDALNGGLALADRWILVENVRVIAA